MALNNAAADAAVDTWVASITPAPQNPTAIRDAMRPLVRAIFAGIAANAVVTPGTMTADGVPVIGLGVVT